MTSTRAVLVGAVLAGFAAVAFAQSPAAADVTVTPTVAPRGGPAELTFHISEQRPGAHTTKIVLIPPKATPIAEVYPLSVADWAPITATRKLSQPIELIHGAMTTSIVDSVTWTRVPNPKWTGDTELTVALGPMPQSASAAFTVVQTYSDGTVVRWGDGTHPAPTVNLVAPPPEVAGQHQHGGAATGSDTAAAADQEILVEEETVGHPWLLWIMGGALLLGLAFTAEGLAFAALERRQTVA